MKLYRLYYTCNYIQANRLTLAAFARQCPLPLEDVRTVLNFALPACGVDKLWELDAFVGYDPQAEPSREMKAVEELLTLPIPGGGVYGVIKSVDAQLKARMGEEEHRVWRLLLLHFYLPGEDCAFVLARAIILYLLKSGRSLDSLAKASGLTTPHLRRLLNKTQLSNPRLGTCAKIARSIGVRTRELLDPDWLLVLAGIAPAE